MPRNRRNTYAGGPFVFVGFWNSRAGKVSRTASGRKLQYWGQLVWAKDIFSYSCTVPGAVGERPPDHRSSAGGSLWRLWRWRGLHASSPPSILQSGARRHRSRSSGDTAAPGDQGWNRPRAGAGQGAGELNHASFVFDDEENVIFLCVFVYLSNI